MQTCVDALLKATNDNCEIEKQKVVIDSPQQASMTDFSQSFTTNELTYHRQLAVSQAFESYRDCMFQLALKLDTHTRSLSLTQQEYVCTFLYEIFYGLAPRVFLDEDGSSEVRQSKCLTHGNGPTTCYIIMIMLQMAVHDMRVPAGNVATSTLGLCKAAGQISVQDSTDLFHVLSERDADVSFVVTQFINYITRYYAPKDSRASVRSVPSSVLSNTTHSATQHADYRNLCKVVKSFIMTI